MAKKFLVLGSVLTALLAYSAMAVAEVLDKTAAEQLVKGNTAYAKDFKYKRNFKLYFDPSGQYKRVDELNNTESGSWNIDNRGELCMSFVSGLEKCRAIDSIGEGQYILMFKGSKSVKFKKIVTGNPDNL